MKQHSMLLERHSKRVLKMIGGRPIQESKLGADESIKKEIAHNCTFSHP